MAGDTGIVWVNRGTIRGKSFKSMLQKAFYMVFNGNFHKHPQKDNVLFHVKYHDIPVLRLVEIV